MSGENHMPTINITDSEVIITYYTLIKYTKYVQRKEILCQNNMHMTTFRSQNKYTHKCVSFFCLPNILAGKLEMPLLLRSLESATHKSKSTLAILNHGMTSNTHQTETGRELIDQVYRNYLKIAIRIYIYVKYDT